MLRRMPVAYRCACRRAAAAPAAAQDKSITVFAAASMKNALDDVERRVHRRQPASRRWRAMRQARRSRSRSSRARRPTCSPRPISTGWTIGAEEAHQGRHARQPARQQAGADRAEGFQDRQRRRSATASTSPSSPATAASRPAKCTAVPVGKYAKAALEKLGVWAAAETKFAMAENVRAALALVARGEAVLGIVYETDAKVEPGVKIVGAFPADSHPADHLSGGRDGERQAGGRRLSRTSCAAAPPRRCSRNMASRS